jgi:CBS domain-containing protein
MSKKVADILKRKTPEKSMVVVSSEITVLEALRIMSDKNVGSVVVIDNGKYQGIMTERDYSRKIALKGRSSTETKVKEILTIELPTVNPKDSIEHCMQLMTDKNIRYLPVFENGTIINIVSINDVVKETILSQEETITHLRDYVHST